MKIPPFLQPGDRVGIVATARWIEPEPLSFAIGILSGWGLEGVCAPNLHSKSFQLAGSDQQRAASLQAMLDDTSLSAILIARGGYGTVRVLEHLDWSGFIKNPRWICGYSDITVLHGVLDRLGIASIHSTMPVSFPNATPEALDRLKQALFGSYTPLRWSGNISEAALDVTGKLTGGNLSVLYSLLGSEDFPDTRDAILFLEDVDEHAYHVDRMMMALRRAGHIHSCKAILLGGMTQMKDNTREFGFPADNPWGTEAEQIIRDHAEKAGVPVVSGFPAGHLNDNRAFYLGHTARLKAGPHGNELQYLG